MFGLLQTMRSFRATLRNNTDLDLGRTLGYDVRRLLRSRSSACASRKHHRQDLTRSSYQGRRLDYKSGGYANGGRLSLFFFVFPEIQVFGGFKSVFPNFSQSPISKATYRCCYSSIGTRVVNNIN